MAMNKFMHPRNIFRTPSDYTELAIKYPEFRKRCKLTLDGKCEISLREVENLIILTKVLLKEHFDLQIDLPDGCLVPTVPLRLNYILWLEDIMSTMKIENPKGIDIGCGASCIYSILCGKKNNWKMVALETNKENLEYAKRNVEMNNLHDRIEIFEQPNKNHIFGQFLATRTDDVKFDFCLCNPPFFDLNVQSSNESHQKNKKRSFPNNVATGKIDELSCEGGEVSFVRRIIEESFMYHRNVRIFSTLVGRKNDLIVILKILKEKQITNLIQAEFCQGNVTRWGLAWSFEPEFILGLVPPLTFRNKTSNFSCDFKWTLEMNKWKGKLKEQIEKIGICPKDIETKKENQINFLIKLPNPNEKNRELNATEIKVETNENISGHEDVLNMFPKLVFKIEAEMIQSAVLHLEAMYLCGSDGLNGCYKWFYCIKNSIQSLLTTENKNNFS